MPSRAQIVTEALTWLHTPYHHQAALRGVGVDCVGLMIGIGRALGCLPVGWRCPVYSPEWHVHRHEDLLCEVLTSLACASVPLDCVQPGDMLGFQFGRVTSHMAVLLPDKTILHASRDDGAVVRHSLRGYLLTRLRCAYAFPGVEGAL